MKKTAAAIMAAAVMCIIIIAFSFRSVAYPPDSIYINDAVKTAAQSASAYETTVILTERLTKAFEDMDSARTERDNALRISLYIAVCVLASAGILLSLYFERKILEPFHKLQSMASRIAAGNLDIPLAMDKHNIFGAFTESFDLMREELRTARENEYQVNQSKKELVASLSHDIKTPVASIKSSMELLLIKSKDENEKALFSSINVKLEQIDTLITNMFHATLEELRSLSVTPAEIQSAEISGLIRGADYSGKIKPFLMPSCIVSADSMRLQQVFDNIVSNSYKYAGTDITVSGFIEDEYLVIDIQDFGGGVSEDELLLLTGKFFRGKNAEKSKGYGLGLYISKIFIEKMSGSICFESKDAGFTARLMLRLA